MDSALKWNEAPTTEELFGKGAFARQDEADDEIFYARDRFVAHLDSTALATVEELIGGLVVERSPAVLDLMASWDSHIPAGLKPSRVVGLGLNRNELEKNPVLTEYLIHDINRDPLLPFPDAGFDAVINTVSVDYMIRPVEVFREVGRILKPGGLYLVIFSNRLFPQKATRIWYEAGENERINLVEAFFRHTNLFDKPCVFISRGLPRPKDDKYAHYGIPSDPVYAVYADRTAAGERRERRPQMTSRDGGPSPEKSS